MDPKVLDKISNFTIEIHQCYPGSKVKEIVISKATKEELEETKKRFGVKCTSAELGYFAFMIKYKKKGSDKITYLMGTPAKI